MYKFSKTSLKRLIGVHPELSFAVMEALKISAVDFGVIDGLRSMERQKALVAAGKSKTYNSYHLYGLAVDLVPYVNGKYTWDDNSAFDSINKAMKTVIKKHNLDIEWGYDKWGWDKPHWQMTGYRDKYDVRKLCNKVC